MQNEDRFSALLSLAVVATAIVLVAFVVIYYGVHSLGKSIRRLVQRRTLDTPKVSTSLDTELLDVEYKGVEMAEPVSASTTPQIISFVQFQEHLTAFHRGQQRLAAAQWSKQPSDFTPEQMAGLYGVYLTSKMDQVCALEAEESEGDA